MDSQKVVVPCPGCSQKLRVPTDRGELTLTCPVCKRSWSWSPKDIPGNEDESLIRLVEQVLAHQRQTLTLDELSILAELERIDPEACLEQALQEMQARERHWQSLKHRLCEGGKLRKINGRRGGFSIELLQGHETVDTFEVVGE